jgi:transposase
MRLQITKSKNAECFYIVKSVRKSGKNTNEVVEKLGNLEEVRKRAGDQDPYEWAREYAKELTKRDKEMSQEITVKLKPVSLIEKDVQQSYDAGYLFLQKLYYELGLDRICRNISRRYKFEYDLNSVLSRLVYGRVLSPGSKLSTMEYASTLLEKPKFELHHIYRALEVIAKETDYIQAELYKSSCSASGRNDTVLYYDVTNYYFEIEEADEDGGLRQYGFSKENRPNPLVQMGLFLDADGIPLAFCINPGNTNENTTLRPLEKQIISDFEHSEFIVCTDSGLSSADNRGFNSIMNRRFITVQSIKKMKGYLREWALSDDDWYCPEYPGKTFKVSEIKADPDKYRDDTFYKDQWYRDNGLSQRFIVTFSIKYMEYLKALREEHVERARKCIQNNSAGRHRQTDPKRFISEISCTDDGEVAENKDYSIDEDKVSEEARYEGFYAVATNLEDDISEIIRINKQRWEIEESFRIMKSEFKARPVYLSRDDRIKAHFTTCFIALVLFRYLEKIKLKESCTCEQLIDTLRSMKLCRLKSAGYIPAYTRTDTTDKLHDACGFRTDYEIIPQSNLRKIISESKKS